jgi:hypothetical protein
VRLQLAEINIGIFRGEDILQVRKRDAVRRPESLKPQYRRSNIHTQRLRSGRIRDAKFRGEDQRRWILPVCLQVFEETRQLNVSCHSPVNDLRPDTTPANKQALVDEFLNRSTNGGAGELQSETQRDFVLEPRASRE